MSRLLLSLLALLTLASCGDSNIQQRAAAPVQIQPGAEQLSLYLPLLKDKKVGLLVNQTSRLGEQHLVDVLLAVSAQSLGENLSELNR